MLTGLAVPTRLIHVLCRHAAAISQLPCLLAAFAGKRAFEITKLLLIRLSDSVDVIL